MRRRAAGERPASQFARGLELQALGEKTELCFEVRHTLLELLDFLTFGVRQVAMLQRLNWLSAARAHHASRNADDGRGIRHRTHHYRTCADLYVVADPDAAQNFRAGAYHHAVAQSGMALSFFIAGAAQRYALVEQAIVPDFRGFADDHARTVVDEKTPADAGARMDLNAGQEARELGNHT